MNNGAAEWLWWRGFISRENKVALKLIFGTKRVTENQLIAYYSVWSQSQGNSGDGLAFVSANAHGGAAPPHVAGTGNLRILPGELGGCGGRGWLPRAALR